MMLSKITGVVGTFAAFFCVCVVQTHGKNCRRLRQEPIVTGNRCCFPGSEPQGLPRSEELWQILMLRIDIPEFFTHDRSDTNRISDKMSSYKHVGTIAPLRWLERSGTANASYFLRPSSTQSVSQLVFLSFRFHSGTLA